MTARDVTPNRRGIRSREAVLDAAERLMSEHGYDAATAAQIVKASGIPISSLYHYFGSKQGVLLAVMERGARRFFDALPAVSEPLGSPEEHLTELVREIARVLRDHPNFLRLVLVFATQPASAEEAAAVHDVVGRVRDAALVRLRDQLAMIFGIRASGRVADRLARFMLATFDGAFVAQQSDGVRLERLLDQLPAALIAMQAALTA